MGDSRWPGYFQARKTSKEEASRIKTKPKGTWRKKENTSTCFNDMGNVSRPHCSGVFTISLVISLHDLQTEAQWTTTARAGHEVSLSSTLLMISKSNSGGRFAHWPCSIWSVSAGVSSGAICDLALPRQCFPSSPRLDMFPIPSFISFNSRTMLLMDILTYRKFINPFIQYSTITT